VKSNLLYFLVYLCTLIEVSDRRERQPDRRFIVYLRFVPILLSVSKRERIARGEFETLFEAISERLFRFGLDIRVSTEICAAYLIAGCSNSYASTVQTLLHTLFQCHFQTMSRQTPSIKGTCPVCREDVNADEPHERTYKHRNCEAPSSPTTVYVLVRTSDKWPPAAHYECQAESTVIGVYATYGQARKAKLEATEGWRLQMTSRTMKGRIFVRHLRFLARRFKTMAPKIVMKMVTTNRSMIKHQACDLSTIGCSKFGTSVCNETPQQHLMLFENRQLTCSNAEE